MSAAPSPQAAALGATIEVTTQGGTNAAYTVSNFRPATPVNAYFPVKGRLHSVDLSDANRDSDPQGYRCAFQQPLTGRGE